MYYLNLYQNTTPVGLPADTSEHDLMTYTLPGGTLTNNGDRLEITAWGTFSSPTSDKWLMLKFGSEDVFLTEIGVSTDWWILKGIVVRTGATAQSVVGSLASLSVWNEINSDTLAQTLANNLDVKVRAKDEAGTANGVVQQGFIVTCIRAAGTG